MQKAATVSGLAAGSALSWPMIFQLWQQAFHAHHGNLFPLFAEFHVHDAGAPDKKAQASTWWHSDALLHQHAALQARLDAHPGTLHDLGKNDALAVSAGLLWDLRFDAGRIAAFLILASLQQHDFASEGVRQAPGQEALQQLTELCLQQLSDVAIAAMRQAHGLLPETRDARGRNLSTLSSLLAFLAGEHAHVLATYTPAHVSFRPVRSSLSAATNNNGTRPRLPARAAQPLPAGRQLTSDLLLPGVPAAAI